MGKWKTFKIKNRVVDVVLHYNKKLFGLGFVVDCSLNINLITFYFPFCAFGILWYKKRE